MKANEENQTFKNKSVKELTKNLNEAYLDLQKLRFSQKFRKLKDTNKVRKTKKTIARIWTNIRLKSK